VIIISKSQKKNTTKFNVSKDTAKRTYNGITFASELEMRFYRDVVLPKSQSGEIKSYQMQVAYILQPKFVYNGKTILPIEYKADFVIEDKTGHITVIDTKGRADAVAKIKRKMFHYVYPDIDYQWISESKCDGGWVDYDLLQSNRRKRRKQKLKSKE
jgi:hypothetical protein